MSSKHLRYHYSRADLQWDGAVCNERPVDELVKLCACFPMTLVYLDWFLSSVSDDVDDSGAYT